MKSKQFDERQIQIRGQISFHGLIVLLGLVLVNGIMQDNMIAWANGFDQNLLIVIFTVMLVSVEAILRGALFGRIQIHWPMIGIYGLFGVIIIVFYSIRFLHGDSFIEDRELSTYGANFITGLMLIITTLIGVFKELSERNEKNTKIT